MFEFFLTDQMLPFSIGFALFFGFLALEVIAMLIGFSFDSDGAEVDFDGAEIGFEAETGLDLDTMEAGEALEALESFEAADADVSLDGGFATDTSFLGWIGFKKVPTVLFIASFALAFGLSGLTLQFALSQAFGLMLPAVIAVVPALVGTVFLGRFLCGLIAAIVPKTESTAITHHLYTPRRGVIAQGTARDDLPATARFTDGYGNLHHVSVYPFERGTTIPEGTEVMIIRKRRDDKISALALG
jgi:hypothetical protein